MSRKNYATYNCNNYKPRKNQKYSNFLNGNKEFPYLMIDAFPSELQQLEPYHIENFLCIYKNEFPKLSIVKQKS